MTDLPLTKTDSDSVSVFKEPVTKAYGLNKEVFLPKDRVRVLTEGAEGAVGEVVGVSMRHIIDIYIVLLDEPLPEYPWRAACFPSGQLEKI